MSRSARIVSTGSYVPEIEVSNDVLRERFKASAPEFVDKMEAASGITTRWYAPPDWATSDLAVRAAQKALAAAGKTPLDVDLVLLGTDSPDFVTPATSVVVQHKLGARNAGHASTWAARARRSRRVSRRPRASSRRTGR